MFKSKKNKYIIGGAIAIIIIILIVIRFVMVYSLNEKYIKSMNYDKTLGQAKYYAYDNGYCFKYASASFFHMECFASVCSEDDMKLFVDEDGKVCTDGMQITFYIWPHSHEFGVDFYQNENGIEISMQIMVDKELNYCPKGETMSDEEQAHRLLEQYKADILKLREEAERKWNLNASGV